MKYTEEIKADDKQTHQLRTWAYDFCNLFAQHAEPSVILSRFRPFKDEPVIIEHGLKTPELPFLDTFRGKDIARYFDLLGKCLSYEDIKFWDYAADPLLGIVTIKGSGKFTCLATKQSWREQFVYVLSRFDHEGRVGSYEVWADPLSAYLASRGQLPQEESN